MLSILIWLPAAAALIGAIAGGERAPAALTLLGSLGSLALAIALIAGYNGSAGELTHVTDVVWIRSLGIHYHIGVNGLNLFLVAMTTFVFALSLLAANLRSWTKPTIFYLLLGIAESAVLGAFLAQDLALFVAFFDLMLIPFYLITGIWGGPGRVAATTKLVIYTLVGSLLMLAGAVALAVLTSHAQRPADSTSPTRRSPASRSAGHTGLDLPALRGRVPRQDAGLPTARLDARRLPGDADRGARDLQRRALEGRRLRVPGDRAAAAPAASVHFQTLMLVIGLASILYGSAMAFTQTNARLIVGYSSVAQLGFITIGIFALAPQSPRARSCRWSTTASSSPRCSSSSRCSPRAPAALRTSATWAGSRRGRRSSPRIFLVVTFATLAMPGSGNFIGEFLILLGLFKTKMAFSIIAFAGVVMAAVYMLRIFIRTMHNRTGPHVASRELRWRDALVLVPFIAAIGLFAVYPQLELSRAQTSVTNSINAAVVSEAPVSA